MKRFISVSTLMCLLVTSVFTGCGDKDATTSNFDVTSSISSESNASEENKQTIEDDGSETTESNQQKDTTTANSDVTSSISNESNTSEENKQTTENGGSETTVSNNQNVASYRYEPVEFEISDSSIFKADSSIGVFSYNNKAGLINSDGKVVLDAIYKNLSNPSEGYLLAEQEDGSILIMNEEGVEQAKVNYTKELTFGGSIPADRAFINGYSSLGIKESDSESPQNVIIDTKGKVLFETNLSRITITDKDVIVGLDFVADHWNPPVVGIDMNGNQLWSMNVRQFPKDDSSPEVKDNLIVYKSNDNNLWGAIDVNGNQVLECKYEELSYAGDGLIGVLKYGKWGYMDYDGNMVIEPQFTGAYEFIKQRALVKMDGNYCVIDTKGNILFYLDNNSAIHYENGLFYNNSDTNIRLLDENGNTIFEIPFETDYMDMGTSNISYNGGNVFYTWHKNNGARTYQYYKLIKN